MDRETAGQLAYDAYIYKVKPGLERGYEDPWDSLGEHERAAWRDAAAMAAQDQGRPLEENRNPYERGRAAYDAYATKSSGGSFVAHEMLPEWDQLDVQIREAWIAAAVEVAAEFLAPREFKFDIGDIVAIRAALAEADAGRTPRPLQILEQLRERCPGGEQLHYYVRAGKEIQRVLELELIAWGDDLTQAAIQRAREQSGVTFSQWWRQRPAEDKPTDQAEESE